MGGTFLWISLFAILSSAVNASGIFVVYRRRGKAEKMMPFILCFAAGVLISTPLMIALPEAVLLNHNAGIFALGGFLFMFFSNRVISCFTDGESLAFGITAAQGIGIHSFIDGVVYAVTFEVSLLVGILSAGGLVVHEFAEGVITYLVLLKGGVNGRLAIVYAFLIASITTPLGAFVAYPFIKTFDGRTLGILLGFVSGVLIYVSASHLLPEARGYEKKHSFFAFLAGVVLAIFIVMTHGH
ncbi:MAG TPA: zinc/iron permease [Desulfobacteraceae bacterium]|nr:zinc/iron permease [Desulfobacteraceae bacterium]